MFGTCKNCTYWKFQHQVNGVAECEKVDDTTKDRKLTFEIEVYVHDDSGLYTILNTGENFGCIHFKERV